MLRCCFRLNCSSLSTLSVPGVGLFPAYSGNAGVYRNNPDAADIKDIGPLPPGKYYIVSRPLGGYRTMVLDYFRSQASGSDRSLWFALYREDNNIDDYTFYNGVERGHFRLHPAGYQGISNGCITLPSRSHFMILREALLSKHNAQVRVTAQLTAYGTVQVY